jgi:hypothetical protein
VTHLKDVELVCGILNVTDSPLSIFSNSITSFLNDLSLAIFNTVEAKNYPELATFAFWCRKSNIAKLNSKYSDVQNRLGRGICFHITPSNIPINFAYSYVFSLLAGNSNIVKLPSKSYPQIEILCRIFSDVLEKHPDIKIRTAFVKYPRTSESTEYFSKLSDCRMIWGGDLTILELKKVGVRPRVVDVLFADRYSICLLNGSAILDLNENDLERLCDGFYNDTFLIDQNACSSPQLIAWINDSSIAREKFWQKMLSIVQKKYQLQESHSIDKWTKFCEDSINLNEKITLTQHENYIYRIELKKLDNGLSSLRGKFGYFYEYAINSYYELFPYIDPKFQTLTYFGIDSKQLLEQIIDCNVKGIDRIVPVGKALDIELHWDGHDLIRELSREIISI